MRKKILLVNCFLDELRIPIRKGYWQQIEVYIAEHSEADFSHGLCPQCLEKARAEIPAALRKTK